MAEELNWSDDEQKRQHAEAVKFVREEMGQQVNRQSRDKIPINLSREEISNYIKRFQALDQDKKGYISINDIRRGLKVHDILYKFHTFFLFRISNLIRSVWSGRLDHVNVDRILKFETYFISQDWRSNSQS